MSLHINKPIIELTPEHKTLLTLRYQNFKKYTLLGHTCPSHGQPIMFKVKYGEYHIEPTIQWEDVLPEVEELIFERIDKSEFLLYITGGSETSVIEGCTEEFLYLLNKTINPMYDEAFRIDLINSRVHNER